MAYQTVKYFLFTFLPCLFVIGEVSQIAHATMYKCQTPRGVEYQQTPCATEVQSKEIKGNVTVLPGNTKEYQDYDDKKSQELGRTNINKEKQKPEEKRISVSENFNINACRQACPSANDSVDQHIDCIKACRDKQEAKVLQEQENSKAVSRLRAALLSKNGQDIEIALANINPSNVNQESTGETPIISASHAGNLYVVQALLSKGADINAKSSVDGSTALMEAASGRHVNVVQALLDKGADINITKKDGATTLMLASAEKGNLDVVKALLDKNADVNIQDREGRTALMFASGNNSLHIGQINIDIMQALLNKEGIDINKKSGGLSTLMQAAAEGRLEVAQALLDKNADVNMKASATGDTALIIASEKGELKIVQAILGKNGTDVNIRNNKDRTALIEATRSYYNKHSLEIVKALLNKNADVNIKDSDGNRALNYASSHKSVDIEEALLKSGARAQDSSEECQQECSASSAKYEYLKDQAYKTCMDFCNEATKK